MLGALPLAPPKKDSIANAMSPNAGERKRGHLLKIKELLTLLLHN